MLGYGKEKKGMRALVQWPVSWLPASTPQGTMCIFGWAWGSRRGAGSASAAAPAAHLSSAAPLQLPCSRQWFTQGAPPFDGLPPSVCRAAGTTRRDSEMSGDREVQRTMLELLNQLDGFSSNDSVKIIAATNRPDILDPALMRSGGQRCSPAQHCCRLPGSPATTAALPRPFFGGGQEAGAGAEQSRVRCSY